MTFHDTNEMVNSWIIKEFRESDSAGVHHTRVSNPGRPIAYSIHKDDKVTHLQECATLRVTECDSEWDCGCYSSWTREDVWSIVAHLTCEHDVTVKYRVYSTYDNVFDALREYDRESFTCRIEDRENDY